VTPPKAKLGRHPYLPTISSGKIIVEGKDFLTSYEAMRARRTCIRRNGTYRSIKEHQVMTMPESIHAPGPEAVLTDQEIESGRDFKPAGV
jgi:hypothetical protein